MAEGIRFVCSGCGNVIEAWSDGKPFYIDEDGEKKYAYHPDHDELEKCIANDLPFLCLNCGEESNVDSRLEPRVCPKCASENMVDTFYLSGVKCPKCKVGQFDLDDDFRAIS